MLQPPQHQLVNAQIVGDILQIPAAIKYSLLSTSANLTHLFQSKHTRKNSPSVMREDTIILI